MQKVNVTEVTCPHGNREYVPTNGLKTENTTSCRHWKECGLTKAQDNHLKYESTYSTR